MVIVRGSVITNWLLREKVEFEGVTGNWRRLHNEELYDLCFLPNIIRVIKSRLR